MVNDFTVSFDGDRAYGQIAYEMGIAGKVIPDASDKLEDESLAADKIHDKFHIIVDLIRSGHLDLNDRRIPLARVMDLARHIEKRLRLGQRVPDDVQAAVHVAIKARLP